MQGKEVGMQGGRGVQGAVVGEEPERSEAERSSAERSGGSAPTTAGAAVGVGPSGPSSRPDPEVDARPVRRRFTAEYKLSVLRQADTCSEPGEVGALLRREGLYSSHLTLWRQQRLQGRLGSQKRGRRGVAPNPLASRVAELERDNRRLSRRLKKAETIIEFQKNSPRFWGSR